MRVRVIVLACLLAPGCKDEDAPKEDTPAQPEPASDEQQPEGEDGGKPGPGLAATFRGALSGKRPVRSLKLIPKGATVLGGADVQQLVSSSVWATIKAASATRQRDQLDAVTKCGVGSDKWRSFVAGASARGDDMAMVVEAEGLGTRPVLDCLVAELGNFELSEDGKRLSDATGGGIVLSDDVIAFASPAWMPLVEQRIEGQGEAAVDELGGLMARADRTKTMWFVGKDLDGLDGLSATFGSDIEDFSGWVDLRSSMSVRLFFTVPDAEKARTTVEAKWKGVQSFAREMVPSGMVDSVRFTNEGKRVGIELEASKADLNELASKFADAL